MALLDALKAFAFGHPTPPVSRKSAGFGGDGAFPYAGRYVMPTPLAAGVLIHGPGATAQYQDAAGQSAAGNSAAAACLSAIMVAYVEAPVRVYRYNAGKQEIIEDHPILALLRRPNPFMTGRTLFAYTQWCKHVDGNAYWRKIRAGDPDSGNVVQWWPISPSAIEIQTDKGTSDFISRYRFHRSQNVYEDIAPHNIAHFRLGLDDQDHRKGMGPIKQLFREISSDREATAFADALLRNSAVAGGVIETPADMEITREEAEEAKARMEAAFMGDNRGRIAVISPGGKFHPFGFSPKELDLKELHRLPEERISAVLRVPAIVAGLGAGLEHATYSNVQQARQLFAEQTILPLYADDDETITALLLPEFEADPAVYVAHDVTDMRSLQDDEDAKYKRLDMGVVSGWIAPDEARADIGLPPIPDGSGVLPRPLTAPNPPGLPSVAPPSPGRTKALDIATKAAKLDLLPEQLMQARENAIAEYEQVMQTAFKSQMKRVIHKIEAAG